MEKSTVIRILNLLIEKGLVEKEGSAKATVYRKKPQTSSMVISSF